MIQNEPNYLIRVPLLNYWDSAHFEDSYIFPYLTIVPISGISIESYATFLLSLSKFSNFHLVLGLLVDQHQEHRRDEILTSNIFSSSRFIYQGTTHKKDLLRKLMLTINNQLGTMLNPQRI